MLLLKSFLKRKHKNILGIFFIIVTSKINCVTV